MQLESRGWRTGDIAQQVKRLLHNGENLSSNLRAYIKARYVIPAPGKLKDSVSLLKHNSATVDIQEFTPAVQKLQSTDQDSRISIPSFLREV